MQQGWRIAATVVIALGYSSAYAAGPGVPSLGSTAQDYVGYAVSDLPDHYQAPALANANNTPADNPITNAGAELGRVLFYDGRLSHNDGTSCASCHVQENGFSDPNQFSIGFEGGLTGRHSMGLTNAAYYARGRFFWDERASTLEEQVLMPIEDAVEMGSNLDDLEQELQATEFYPELFERAFGDDQVTSERMAAAMAQFVRSMVSYQSKFDQALEANQLSDVLTADEAAGHAIFGQRCDSCHRSDAQIAPSPNNIGLDEVDADPGDENGDFKVPSLRNIAVRDGFMHDGRFTTLEEVIEFYSSGVQDNDNLGRGLSPGGFGFTETEKAQLLAFMNTLTDDAFLTSDLFSDPFVDLPGDYNGDGLVDADDYLVWKEDFLAAADQFAPLMADGDNDGIVNIADYSIWRDNLGARWDDGVAAAVSFASTPEPGASVLVLALLAAGCGLRQRQCCRSG
ncbi:MAG: cytochrome c peroxidase [Planctomycetota bacterium]